LNELFLISGDEDVWDFENRKTGKFFPTFGKNK